MKTEEWATVPDWPQYEVSRTGQVRSWCTPGFTGRKPRLPKYRKLTTGKDGYVRVTLFENSHGRDRRIETWSIHRLVAICFGGEADHSLDVAHLDGVKTNNNIENLKWCTRKENESHKVLHETKAEGEKNGQSKLCSRAVKAIKNLARNEKWTQQKIADLFQISQSNVGAILLEKSWRKI